MASDDGSGLANHAPCVYMQNKKQRLIHVLRCFLNRSLAWIFFIWPPRKLKTGQLKLGLLNTLERLNLQLGNVLSLTTMSNNLPCQ